MAPVGASVPWSRNNPVKFLDPDGREQIEPSLTDWLNISFKNDSVFSFLDCIQNAFDGDQQAKYQLQDAAYSIAADAGNTVLGVGYDVSYFTLDKISKHGGKVSLILNAFGAAPLAKEVDAYTSVASIAIAVDKWQKDGDVKDLRKTVGVAIISALATSATKSALLKDKELVNAMTEKVVNTIVGAESVLLEQAGK